MTLALVIALSLSTELQVPASDRSHAAELARAGQTTEAIELFKRIVEKDPGDIEARLWIARLDLRLGRTEAAEAGFRSVLEEHPADIDARVGLGMTLTRKGASAEALAVLREAELQAGENADLFGALARAYRRLGDDQRALEYFEKAKTLSPSDPDLVSGYESTAYVYGHSIVFEGFGENVSLGSDAISGSVLGMLRATPRLHLQALARLQNRAGASDTLGGGGVVWRAARETTVQLAATGGAGNVSLPTGSAFGEVIHYAGALEVGGSVRWMFFDGVDVTAVSPLLSWDAGGRWRFDTRYTYSQSRFDTTGESVGNHSLMLRETWRGWRRVWVTGVYAYGIESFEDLTVDRVSSLGATTVAAGLRFSMPSLTAINTTWEHQWRSNDSQVDRFTVSIVQAFP
jgi:YaiO family outer membrane protein